LRMICSGVCRRRDISSPFLLRHDDGDDRTAQLLDH
jgi:hypothetical protein